MKVTENKIDLTEETRDIFGDIVEYAYVAKPVWSSDFNEKCAGIIGVNSIEPKDAYPIFVKFTNGKEFELWSSEWGGVQSVSEEEYLNSIN